MSRLPNELSEKHDQLWWVAAPPAIWAGHFLLSYVTAAVWCAKFALSGSLWGARVAIAGYTAVALALVAGVALRGLRQYQRGARAAADSPEARHHFLGFALLSLSGLTALAIVYAALAAVFIGSCD